MTLAAASPLELARVLQARDLHTASVIGSDFQKQMVAGAPLGRFGAPEDIARLAVFLASDDAAWVTGERIQAAGGYR